MVSNRLLLEDCEKNQGFYQQYVFDGQGVPDPSSNGDYIAQVHIKYPKELDKESIELFKTFAMDEPPVNKFDPTLEFYSGPPSTRS